LHNAGVLWQKTWTALRNNGKEVMARIWQGQSKMQPQISQDDRSRQKAENQFEFFTFNFQSEGRYVWLGLDHGNCGMIERFGGMLGIQIYPGYHLRIHDYSAFVCMTIPVVLLLLLLDKCPRPFANLAIA
jgi:hypothetical protein